MLREKKMYHFRVMMLFLVGVTADCVRRSEVFGTEAVLLLGLININTITNLIWSKIEENAIS